MKYFVHVGSAVYGGDLFGPYHNAQLASEAVGRLALEAFRKDRHAIVARSYTIIAAKSKSDAEDLANSSAS